ncbi:MAG: serine/threonine-protein kinase [Myxococcota bacterium]
MPPGARPSPYTYVCEIARGGMASVSLVLRHEGDFAREYAMKRLLPVYETDVDVRTMFRDEARIAGLVRHPNVVSVLDVGKDADGVYLVMDYVEGISLGRALSVVGSSGQPIPLQVCLRIAAQIAEGLHAAHELTDDQGAPLNLVHRDVSPANVLLGLDGLVRVTDFGIAKALGRRAKTSTGLLKGKTGYMAPELLRFEAVDRRVDLFALGVVLYELLTCTRLYQEPDLAAAARRILHEPPPDIGLLRPEVPDELVNLMFRLLAKEPSLRPDTARVVADELTALVQDLELAEGRMPVSDFVKEIYDHGSARVRRTLVDQVKRGERPATLAPAVERAPGTSLRRVAKNRAVQIGVGVALLGVGVWVGTQVGTVPNEDALRVDLPEETVRQETAERGRTERETTEREMLERETPVETGEAVSGDSVPGDSVPGEEAESASSSGAIDLSDSAPVVEQTESSEPPPALPEEAGPREASLRPTGSRRPRRRAPSSPPTASKMGSVPLIGVY